MKFRPCIDIHNGAVKQIVGGSLKDTGDKATNNFISEKSAGEYARLYKDHGLTGGHIILLNPADSMYYEKDLEQAKEALAAFQKGMQIGGGVNEKNAEKFLSMGASHVIVTSYVFRDGIVDFQRLKQLSNLIGKEHLVLDLSCRKVGQEYRIVTNRWQKVTNVPVTKETMQELASYCDEFLIHAVDVEGKSAGIDRDVLSLLALNTFCKSTYAGGIHSMEDIYKIQEMGHSKVDFTVGSSLDLFGGTLEFNKLSLYNK